VAQIVTPAECLRAQTY